MSERFASVWDAIEPNPEEAHNMKMRSKLMIALSSYIKKSGMSQTKAGKHFQLSQPKICALMGGKINLFSLDKLVSLAELAHLKVDLEVHDCELEHA
jgi:predicted XRE-type DNA-binding protein